MREPRSSFERVCVLVLIGLWPSPRLDEMRQMPLAAYFLATLLLACQTSLGTPIYLHQDSRFPSGNNSRDWLEAHTLKVQFQRWAKVQTADGKQGWVEEDHLLTPLKLAENALVSNDVPARIQPELDNFTGRTVIKKDSKVEILNIRGSWTQVRTLDGAISYVAWIQNESLKPLVGGALTKAFVHKSSPLFVMPDSSAHNFGQIQAERFVEVIRELKNGFLEIRTGQSRGYIRKSSAWTLSDLGATGVRPLLSLTPLRSQPVPYSEALRQMPLSTTLKVLSSKVLRWGAVEVAELGTMWWPMTDEQSPTDPSHETGRAKDKVLKLSTDELFSRKLFDMAASRVIPSLKFASAQGVFKTTDGETWTQIPSFKDQNYPIAFAKGGAVFIGPYVSEDRGETFQQWIRWDSLIATLNLSSEAVANNVQIIEVHPRDLSGRKLMLSLNVGQAKPVQVVTDDQGLSWRNQVQR
jgi:SH3-like domain-containing protein